VLVAIKNGFQDVRNKKCAPKYAVQVAAVQPKLPGEICLAHRAFVQQSL
jgi:hypothetical protein